VLPCFVPEIRSLFNLLSVLSYVKTENLNPGDIALHQHDYLLAESKSKHSPEMKILQQTHDIVEFVDCFHNIGLQYKSLLPVRINTRPCIYILQKREDADLGNLMPGTLSFDSSEQEAFVEQLMQSELESVEVVEEKVAAAPIEVQEADEKSYAELLQDEDYTSTPEPDMVEVEEVEDNEPEEIRDDQETDEPEAQDLPTIDVAEEEPVRLKRVYKSPKAKLQEQKHTKEDVAATTPPKRAKSNIQKIIKTAKAKQMIDDLSKLDLNEYCDLSKISPKDCLKRVIDEETIFET
jgi:alpha-1,6-mannosyltransferase